MMTWAGVWQIWKKLPDPLATMTLPEVWEHRLPPASCPYCGERLRSGECITFVLWMDPTHRQWPPGSARPVHRDCRLDQIDPGWRERAGEMILRRWLDETTKF